MADLCALATLFHDRFGAEPEIIVRSPGRVEIVGGHTDYNDGFVLPMAIERECVILSLRRADGRVRVFSELYGEMHEFELSASLTSGQPGWANYAKGVAALLVRADKSPVGLDMYVWCDVPAGGGLSSSAALEVGYAKSFLAAADDSLDSVELALLCQEAEQSYAGTPCGIMDQFICIVARSGHALLLDCRSLEYEHVPIRQDRAAILIADTRVNRELEKSEYGVRRAQCEQAVKVISRRDGHIKALRDVDPEMLETWRAHLDPTLYSRVRHVVTENDRVCRAAQAFREDDLTEVGAILTHSHASCRDDYEISCAELDFLVDAACACRGVYGARMSGGGFGGCVVALIDPAGAQAVESTLIEAYANQFGIEPKVYVSGASGGAEVIKS